MKNFMMFESGFEGKTSMLERPVPNRKLSLKLRRINERVIEWMMGIQFRVNRIRMDENALKILSSQCHACDISFVYFLLFG